MQSIAVSFLMALLISCQTQVNDNQAPVVNKQISQPQIVYQNNKIVEPIKLIFFPSGSATDVRYSIILKGDSLKYKNFWPTSESKLKSYNKSLTKDEVEKINSLVINLKNSYFSANTEVDDSWSAIIEINGKIVYEGPPYRTTNTPYTPLINYLVSLLPFKFKLYGFS